MTYFEELINKAKEINKPINQVLAVSGSPRKGGNSDIIMKQILSGLESENMASESAQLSSVDFSGCIGCEKCRKDKICTMLQDGMSVLYPSIIVCKYTCIFLIARRIR